VKNALNFDKKLNGKRTHEKPRPYERRIGEGIKEID
jgi:hypothetical protein